MSLAFFNSIYNAMLNDFGTIWIVALILSLGLFFLLLSVLNNFQLALIFTLTPVLLFASINLVIYNAVGYIVIIAGIFFTIAIYRVFVRWTV